ncbi:MAG: hypothetical protein IJE14_05960 [Clostridia bacterium]|nr:hypothetical protein [Clostridia bacterium]
MSLLTTSEAKNKIAEQVRLATEQLHIISAFCKKSALEFIESNIQNNLSEKKILVRFLLSDIVNGVTDFELYEYCKANGWKLYIRFDLHAKTYVFDRKRLVLGSANLTNNGLGLNYGGNYELSYFADIESGDLKKIDSLFDNAVLMTDELYENMKLDYQSFKDYRSNSKPMKWNLSIEKQFNPVIDALFTYDFPSISEPNFDDVSCFEFLELNRIPTKDELKEAFRWSKVFLWLYNYVSNASDKTRYFGAITAELHNTLINDPRPYRKEVKDLLANLLKWIQILDMKEICIDTPNHSQRISINI